MKKIFTLIAVAMMTTGVNAQSWVPTEEAPAAGTAIIDNDLLTVTTAFGSTNAIIKDEDDKPSPVTYGDYTFRTYTQIRVTDAPTADTPTGTTHDNGTSLVIVAKKNVDITYYYRRQAASGAYADNDGKDIKLIDQASPSKAIAANTDGFKYTDIDGSYANTEKTISLTAGKTYTLWARGTTGRLYAIDYKEGQGGQEVTPVDVTGTVVYSWSDSFSAANKVEFDDGTTIQITGNESKNISNGAAITVDGKTYTTMKVSNGAQNTLTLPAGKVTKKVTFYSYVNKDAATDRDSYWKEVAGVNYETADAAGGIFASYKDTANPDKREYTFDAANAVTFTNTGEQCCYIIVVEVEAGSASINSVQNVKIQNGVSYNLAGQKVGKGYKGIVLENGKKMIRK